MPKSKKPYAVWPKGRNTPILVDASDAIEARDKAVAAKKAGSKDIPKNGAKVRPLSDPEVKVAKRGGWVRSRPPGMPQKSDYGGFKYRPQLKSKSRSKNL